MAAHHHAPTKADAAAIALDVWFYEKVGMLSKVCDEGMLYIEH